MWYVFCKQRLILVSFSQSYTFMHRRAYFFLAFFMCKLITFLQVFTAFSTPHTTQWTLNLLTIHSAQQPVHCTLYTTHCTLYNTVQCTLYTVNCKLNSIHCTLHTVHLQIQPYSQLPAPEDKVRPCHLPHIYLTDR